MKSGDNILLPRNIQHTFIQLTEKGKMKVSYLPARKMEVFFKVTDKGASPPTNKEIAKDFADHDMKVFWRSFATREMTNKYHQPSSIRPTPLKVLIVR